jgi:hypothetical protein
MIGVEVLAVTVSAVVLPSGAVVLLAVTEQEPPFLSHVPTLKSSEYFAMFSKAPPTVWNAPLAQDDGAGRGVRGSVADLRRGVGVRWQVARPDRGNGHRRARARLLKEAWTGGREIRASAAARKCKRAGIDVRGGVRVAGVRLGRAGTVH